MVVCVILGDTAAEVSILVQDVLQRWPPQQSNTPLAEGHGSPQAGDGGRAHVPCDGAPIITQTELVQWAQSASCGSGWAINADLSDPKAFVEAVRKVKMSEAESPRGPFYFDSFGNPNQNIYIKKVVKKDGKLMNIAVKTYNNVSQFGPYANMAEKYMAGPATTRDYPPGKKAEYFVEIEKWFGKDYVENLKKNGGWK